MVLENVLTNELIYKTEMDTHIENKFLVTKGESREGTNYIYMTICKIVKQQGPIV